GTITDFRAVNESSIAMSGYDIGNGEVYELLAGFDSGKNTEYLRSIGVIKAKINDTTNNLKEATFTTVNGLEFEYDIVDAYESEYGLTEGNFPNTKDTSDPSKEISDTRNLNDYETKLSSEEASKAIQAPTPSKNTAAWDGFEWSEPGKDRDTKSTDGSGDASSETETTETDGATGDKETDAALNDTVKDDAETGSTSGTDAIAAAGAGQTDNTGVSDTADDIGAVPALTAEQEAFLENIASVLLSGTISVEQASTLIGEAGITAEQVDAYIGKGGADTSNVTADTTETAGIPETTVISDTAGISGTAAGNALINTDAAASGEGAVAGVTTDVENNDSGSNVNSEYVDASLPENETVIGETEGNDNSGNGDGSDGGDSGIGSGSGGDTSVSSSDSGSSDSGSSDSGSSDSGSSDSGSSDSGSSDSGSSDSGSSDSGSEE
nr:hypothetical protein [Lachnospiraceae bacterium]